MIKSNFTNLVQELKFLINKARHNVVYAINKEMLMTYFEIGRKIVEEEQKGEKRAEYGKNLIKYLSNELTKECGRGFGISNIQNMRSFYLTYRIQESLSPKSRIHQSLTGELAKLTWTHYCELIKIKDDKKRSYCRKCD